MVHNGARDNASECEYKCADHAWYPDMRNRQQREVPGCKSVARFFNCGVSGLCSLICTVVCDAQAVSTWLSMWLHWMPRGLLCTRHRGRLTEQMTLQGPQRCWHALNAARLALLCHPDPR